MSLENTLCLKQNMFGCNLKTSYQILIMIIFGTNIPDTT